MVLPSAQRYVFVSPPRKIVFLLIEEAPGQRQRNFQMEAAPHQYQLVAVMQPEKLIVFLMILRFVFGFIAYSYIY